MIYNDNFRMLSDEEKAQYKFSFCELCDFYPCELVGEYARFRDNHTPFIPEAVAIPVDASKTTTGQTIDNDVDTLAASLSYDDKALADGCIMSSQYVHQVECGSQRVADGIGDHYKIEMTYDHKIRKDTTDRWDPLQPVFISAQTGQEKNYFIEHTLIPYVRELNYKNKTRQKVLILSNRLALKQQIKNRLEGNSGLDDEGERCYSYNDVTDVMTYHGLLNPNKLKYFESIQKKKESRYIFVICDEAHFFTSDAMFNPHTQRILSTIVRLFRKAIRVYMSATPYDCLEHIREYEMQYKDYDKYHSMVFYHFERDYAYLDVKTYSHIEELYGLIVESINKRKAKWLIFIDDKEKCQTVKAKLEEYGEEIGTPLIAGDKDSKVEKVFAVDASNKSKSNYQSMVLAETLPKDTFVLITTSVLDNGVNLNGINNIVVSDMSKAKVLQMVGRARVSGLDDRKTLYIKRFGVKDVSDRIHDFENQKDAYHSYELAYAPPENPFESRGYSEYAFLNKYYNDNIKNWENAKHWFGRPIKEPTKLYFNEIAKSLLEKLIRQYENIQDEMHMESMQQGKVGQKYLEHQLSWFGKSYCEDDDITYVDKEKAKKAFIAFLESYAESGEQIDNEMKVKVFRPEFTKLYDAAFERIDRSKGRNYSITKMNSLLEDENISYKVVSHSKYWVVEKCDWAQEQE